MGKIAIRDLAKRMGIPGQDLVFKLKSIGARVEDEGTQLDTDVIQAILLGKRLTQPREVILRDTEDTPTPGMEPEEVVTEHQVQANMRPARRAMIQRVESKIVNIDAIRGPMPLTPPGTPPPARTAAVPDPSAATETAPAATTEVAASPNAEATEPNAAATDASASSGKQVKKVRPTRSKARARLISRPEDATSPVKARTGAAPPPPRRPPASRPVARPVGPGGPGGPGGPSRTPTFSRPQRPTGRPAPAGNYRPIGRRRPGPGGRGPMQDMRGFRRPARSTTPVEVIENKPSSERGLRRAKKKQETGGVGIRRAEIPAFKEDRPDGPVTLTEGMTVREFAEKLGVKSKDLIRALVMRGVMANINHILDPETAKSLAGDLGVEVMEVTFEEEVQLRQELDQTESDLEKSPRPPVVTVMGHVDHGKTTLLDAIRSTKVAAGEAGGITQHIGAYQVEANGQKIVFLDTPGHEAFTLMRARGAQVTDLVVLVVAADDGVMPQTQEAIEHARAAKVPIIVAINKIDKDNANPDRVKKDLADREVLVEDWGGDVVAVPMSALKGEGIDTMLEMIILNSEILELKASPDLPARGAVLESRKDIGRGIVATVLVQDGTLRTGDVFVAGSAWGRVRSMADDRGRPIEEALPATPIEVMGFNDLPSAGDAFQVVENENAARSITDFRRREERQRELAPKASRMSLSQLFDRIEKGEAQELAVVVKADVHGSVEVLKDTLEKLSTDKVKLNVIGASVGAITTNDVVFASASEAIIIGFNVRPERNAMTLADKEGVDIRLHTVIYDLADELRKAMTGLLEPIWEERSKGAAEVRETFKVPKIGVIAGCHVSEGVIPRSADVRLLRDNRVVFEGKISSLKRFKDDASEVRSGFECGIGLEGFQDLKPGDVIEAYVREAVAATL